MIKHRVLSQIIAEMDGFTIKKSTVFWPVTEWEICQKYNSNSETLTKPYLGSQKPFRIIWANEHIATRRSQLPGGFN